MGRLFLTLALLLGILGCSSSRFIVDYTERKFETIGMVTKKLHIPQYVSYVIVPTQDGRGGLKPILHDPKFFILVEWDEFDTNRSHEFKGDDAALIWDRVAEGDVIHVLQIDEYKETFDRSTNELLNREVTKKLTIKMLASAGMLLDDHLLLAGESP